MFLVMSSILAVWCYYGKEKTFSSSAQTLDGVWKPSFSFFKVFLWPSFPKNLWGISFVQSWQSLPMLLYLLMKTDFSSSVPILSHFSDPWRQERAVWRSTPRFGSSWELCVWRITTGDVTWMWTQLFSSWSFRGVACNSLSCETYWPLVQAPMGVGFLLVFSRIHKTFLASF